MPNILDNAQTLYALDYDPKQNKTRKVEFESTIDKELQNQEEATTKSRGSSYHWRPGPHG